MSHIMLRKLKDTAHIRVKMARALLQVEPSQKNYRDLQTMRRMADAATKTYMNSLINGTLCADVFEFPKVGGSIVFDLNCMKGDVDAVR